MFSGKRTTTCSIGVVGLGRDAVGGEAAPDSEIPTMVAPATTAVAINANSFLRIRNRGSLVVSQRLKPRVAQPTRDERRSFSRKFNDLCRRRYQLVTSW